MIASAACILFASSAHGALAQAAASDGARLEEIVVTAQRRTENLQTVPVSVVAVSADQIKRSGIQTLEALNRLAPNTIVERVGLFPGAASLSMRGVGYSGIESYTDPDVAVYVNGIYQARNATALSQTLDVSSIEVLRGPQGTLFGRNAYAGAISVQTNRPAMNQLAGSATATLGNYGLRDFDVVGNVPLVKDKLAGRIALRSHGLDGLYKNNGLVFGVADPTLAGNRIGAEHSLTIRPSLRFTPTDKLDIQVIAEFVREHDQASPVASFPLAGSTIVAWGGSQTNPFGDSRLGIPGDGSDPYTTGFSLADRPMNFHTDNYTVDAAYDTGVGKLRFLGNYQKTKSEVWSDGDGSVANIRSSARYEDYHAYSGELQFVSNISDRIGVVAGVFAFQDQYKTTQLSYVQNGANFPPVFTPLNYLVPTSAPAVCTVANTSGCTYPNFAISYINNGGRRTAYAAYAQAEYHLTDALSVVAGVRYSYERKYDYYGTNAALGATGLSKLLDPFSHALPTNPALVFHADPYKNDNLAPRVGVNYKMSPDVFLFAFWQRAYKSGGFNANAADLTAFRTPYGVEKVDNLEGGIKSEFLDHRLRANLNVFYAKYTGLQRSLVTPSPTAPSGVTTVTSNTADLKSYGVEGEFAFRPQRDLTFYANIGWNKSAYTKYCADLNGAEATSKPALEPNRPVCGPIVTVVAGTRTTFLAPQDYSDVRPIRAPRWDITAGAVKDFDLDAGTVSAQAGLNYRSSMATDLLDRPYSARGAMTTIDASLKWTPQHGRYWVSVWGRNLTNTIGILGYTPNGTVVAFGAPTAPRTFGVTASLNF
jgi:iron complex outermembrane receptor protein